jgi:hypothetical protein
LQNDHNASLLKAELIRGWGRFLESFEWDWFVTLTFDRPITHIGAQNAFRRYVKKLEEAAGQPIAWFLVVERGTIGQLHLHALISQVRRLNRYTWMRIWDKRNGFARIYVFDPRRGAAYYCAKYLPRTDCDFDLSDDRAAFSRVRQRTSGEF